MFYNTADLAILKEELEFIDTAIIPLQHIDMTKEARAHANNIELNQMIVMQVERQLRGRLFITPSVSVINNDLTQAFHYRTQLLDYGFKHVVFLCDKSFDINDNVLEFNQIPLESMSQDMKLEMENEEVKKVMQAIIRLWNS